MANQYPPANGAGSHPSDAPLPAARPADIQAETRTWSMITHLSALLGYTFPFANILAPWAVWQVKKNDLPDIAAHGKAAVNFQITISGIAVILAIIMFTVHIGTMLTLMIAPQTATGFPASIAVFLLGILLLMVLYVFVLTEIMLNAVRANGGSPPRYHLAPNIIK